MRIALITKDPDMVDRVRKVTDKYDEVDLNLFGSLDEFLEPFSNIYRLILVDYLLDEGDPLEVIKRIARLEPEGWLIALSPNIVNTYDLADAGAKITILRNSTDLLESIIEGIVNPRTPEEVEKKYGYTEE